MANLQFRRTATTQDMVEKLKIILEKNDFDLETYRVEDNGVMNLTKANCNSNIELGETGTLEMFGYRKIIDNDHEPPIEFLPEIKIFGADRELKKQYENAWLDFEEIVYDILLFNISATLPDKISNVKWDYQKASTEDMIRRLKVFLKENEFEYSIEILRWKGVMDLTRASCNPKINIGERGKLEVIGSRSIAGRNIPPEINIIGDDGKLKKQFHTNTLFSFYNIIGEIIIGKSKTTQSPNHQNTEQILEHRDTTQSPNHQNTEQILDHRDTTTDYLKIIVRLLKNIDSNTKPKE